MVTAIGAETTAVVTTAGDRCRRCYSCVRRCPAKAIRVQDGQAEVIRARCLACGRCVTVCPRRAKAVLDNLPGTRTLLADGEAVAMLAPSFPAAFPDWRPGAVVAALRRAGFAGVYEVALGAELVSRQHQRHYLEDPERLTITSACPAAVAFVEKYAPSLLPHLAPLLSPMAATGKALKTRLRPGARTVFVGPCTAKLLEAQDREVEPWVDAALTFADLRRLLAERGVEPDALEEEDFDPPHSLLGGIYPVPGGLLKVAGIPTDLLDTHSHSVVGPDSFAEVIERLRARVEGGSTAEIQARFFDVLFCHGCLQGPIMESGESLLRRKERIVDFVRNRPRPADPAAWDRAMADLADLDLGRAFSADDQNGQQPSEADIRAILARTNKLTREDELDCRACGYRSCRDKAVAVYKGLAEVDMCLPYLIERLEATVANLNRSHADLTETQAQLLRAERLASMGQLAAGIAHEINNPLGTVLIYSHLLTEQAESSTQLREDAEMILREATRCKQIVGGLLDFARQSKVNRSLVDVAELLEQAVRSVAVQARGEGLRFSVLVSPDLAPVNLDRDQIEQVLINLVRNAIDAVGESGEVSVSAERSERTGELLIQVRDSGPGIRPEHMSQLFSPFFTTKPVGKGTGLGLPICYGIVKMHHGSIQARNNADGPGATFEVRLPATGGETTHASDPNPPR